MRLRFFLRLQESIPLRLYLFVLPILAGCLAACNPVENPGATTAPFKGVSIGLAAPAGLGLEPLWEESLHEWAAGTGAEFQFREYDSRAETGLAQLLEGEADSRNDLFVFPLSRLAELTATQTLARIPAEEQADTQLNWLDIFHGLREKIVSSQQSPMAVPLSAPVLVCYYRQDLLQQTGLQPPQTWAEYQQLLEKLETWAPGLSAAEPWGEDFRATMFLSRAVAYAQHKGHFSLFFDIETGEPLIDSPGFVRALETAQTALALMPREVLQFEPRMCREKIVSGVAALAIGFETGPGNPQVAGGPQTTAAACLAPRAGGIQLGFCRLPGTTEVYNSTVRDWETVSDGEFNQISLTGFGGLCMGVSAKAPRQRAQAAWNLLVELNMSEGTRFPPGSRTPCRESQLAQSQVWVGDELAPAEVPRYLEAVAHSLRDRRVVAELPLVGHAAFRQALTSNLTKVLAGELQPQAALTATAAAWKQISQELGTDTVRDSYRRSLGLQPLGERK